MKKSLFTLVCLAAMLAAGTGLKAQEVTITLMPGWTWISYSQTESMSIASALGEFVPIDGDILNSQFGSATYNNGQWRGRLQQFTPGMGYMYYSNRTYMVTLVMGNAGTLPTVTTATTSDITTYGVTCGGEVTNTGSSGVLVRGVCWSTQQNPTIDDAHTTDGYGTGSFSSTVEGLSMNTTYYVRAYAMTANGTGYGEQVMFSTKNGVPTLTTSAASEIGTTWATCGGDVSDDGGIEVTERGICWSTSHNPTIAGSHSANGAGLGSFSVNINGLEPNTTYYVRAYATNSHTTAYGNEIFFHTEAAQTWPNGKLPGQFSVSETHQVQFSQGNLQYIGSAATPYWKFADNQWDVLGTTTGQNSSSQNVDRDLFGWGTSGWNNGNTYYHPWDTNNSTGSRYGPPGSYNLTGSYANADWGVYNPISNGGNQANQWRTLTQPEWAYIFNTRTTSSGIRYAKANVNNVNGVILLPDDWSTSYYTLSNTNSSGASFSSNTITAEQWSTMEQHGAVFLPAAGVRDGTSVYNVGGSGYYWSAAYINSDYAYGVDFNDTYLGTGSNYYRYYGLSVRLVAVSEN